MKNYTKNALVDSTSRSFEAKIYKRQVCKATGKCDRCPYHGGENRHKCYPRYLKSWKKNSKRKRQYKAATVVQLASKHSNVVEKYAK